MVGQRWDTDVTEPIDFSKEGWDVALEAFARNTGFRQKRHFIDFFLFTKNLYDEVPPLVVGRSWWDHWLVWKALCRHAAVIDCSSAVVAVHQNHGYGYHPQGKEGTNEDELALQNKFLAGRGRHLRTTADATHVLTSRGNIRRAPFHKLAVQTLPNLANEVIFNTLWIRKPLGLQRRNLEKLMRAIHFKM
jgi:hypothetical protein